MTKFLSLAFFIAIAFLPRAFAAFEQLKNSSAVESKIESIGGAFAGKVAHASRFTSANRFQREIDPAVYPCTVSTDKAKKVLTLHVDGKSISRSYDHNFSKPAEGREITWQSYDDTSSSERGDINDGEKREDGLVLARSLTISRNGNGIVKEARYVEFPLVAFDKSGNRIEDLDPNYLIANYVEYTCWFN